MNINTVLRPVGSSMHKAISMSRPLTKLYMDMLSRFLRPMPDGLYKQRIINSVNSAGWRDTDLPPQKVRLGSATTVSIVPHFHEFDFEAMVRHELVYERDTLGYLESRVPGYDAIIEIGANVGIFSVFFARIFERHGKDRGNIFVFEPSREAFRRLARNAELNGAGGMRIFNCAVGTESGFRDFFEPEGHLTNGSFDRAFAEKFSHSVRKVRTQVLAGRSLQGFLDGHEKVLIKVDVEGAEAEILESIRDLILTKKPALLVEVLPDYEDGLNGLEFLFSAGYSFFNITACGLKRHDKFEAAENRNYILLPEGGPDMPG